MRTATMPNRLARPHVISASEMVAYLDNVVTWYASATTVDGARRKNVGRRGTGSYVVISRNVAVGLRTEHVVYEGPDAEEAARQYNILG